MLNLDEFVKSSPDRYNLLCSRVPLNWILSNVHCIVNKWRDVGKKCFSEIWWAYLPTMSVTFEVTVLHYLYPDGEIQCFYHAYYYHGTRDDFLDGKVTPWFEVEGSNLEEVVVEAWVRLTLWVESAHKFINDLK